MQSHKAKNVKYKSDTKTNIFFLVHSCFVYIVKGQLFFSSPTERRIGTITFILTINVAEINSKP